MQFNLHQVLKEPLSSPGVGNAYDFRGQLWNIGDPRFFAEQENKHLSVVKNKAFTNICFSCPAHTVEFCVFTYSPSDMIVWIALTSEVWEEVTYVM